jgi:hypothetical protein
MALAGRTSNPGVRAVRANVRCQISPNSRIRLRIFGL